MHETRTLAQFVAQIQYADLPASLIDECKIAVLDTFAAGFVGALQPWAQRVVELVRTLGGTPEASVMHQAWQTDVARAALANGALIGAFECEPLTGSHASGTVFPATLAVCEREHCDGKAFLTRWRQALKSQRGLRARRSGWRACVASTIRARRDLSGLR